jgi:predicted dehydrogenase
MTSSSTRRGFLKTTAVVGGTLAVGQNAHAAGAELLKVGLIGCGGRGAGAALQALKADKNVQLYAMADAFDDRLQQSLQQLKRNRDVAGKVAVAPERCFVGFEAYKQVIACCDVVLLCTPPHFRPLQLKAAVDAGKHVFAEKPCAVDAPGVRSVLATAELAKKKGVSLVAGHQHRYSFGLRETAQRVHGGAIGQVLSLQANDFRGTIWVRPRQKDWSDMTWQMRNWYYFTWLSGDFNVEQHVHMIDVASWLKGEYPVKAIGSGGRAVRTGEQYGHIYDHFAIIYEYADGTRLFAQCRQQADCANDISLCVTGSKGTAERARDSFLITGENAWRYAGPQNEPLQTEHDELFASIRNGKPVNNGEYLAKSTLMAILGRMAAYTGQVITWDMAVNSKEDLTPPQYDWNVSLPMPQVARPGVTKYM